MIQVLLVLFFSISSMGIASQGKDISLSMQEKERQEKKEKTEQEITQRYLFALLCDIPEDVLQESKVRFKTKKLIDDFLNKIDTNQFWYENTIGFYFGRKDPLNKPGYNIDVFKNIIRDTYGFLGLVDLKSAKAALIEKVKVDLGQDTENFLKEWIKSAESKEALVTIERNNLHLLNSDLNSKEPLVDVLLRVDAKKNVLEECSNLLKDNNVLLKKFFQTLKTDDRPVIQNFYTHFLKKEQNEQCNIFQTFIDIADLNLIEKLKMSKSAYIANLNSFLDELDSMVETLGRVKKNSKNLQSKYKKVNNKNSVTDFDLDRVLDSINKLSSKSRSAEAKSSFEHVKNAIEKHKKEHARDKKERPLQKELMISRERLVQYKVFCEHTEMVEDHLISNFTVSHAKHWGILLSVVTVAALSTHYKYKKSQEKYLESLHSKLDFIGMSRDKKKEFLSRIDTFYIQWLPYSIRKLIGEDSLDKEIDELYQVVKNKKLDFIHS